MEGKEIMLEKCWLCLRITPKDIAKASHILFSNNLSHQILKKAMNYVERAYKKDRLMFCAKTKYRIIGSLLYLLSLDSNEPKTQRDVSRELKYLSRKEAWNEVTIRNGKKDWVKLFPNEFSSLTAPQKKRELQIRSWRKKK